MLWCLWQFINGFVVKWFYVELFMEAFFCANNKVLIIFKDLMKMYYCTTQHDLDLANT